MKLFKRVIFSISASIFLSSCSPIYVTRSALRQFDLMQAREPISEVLAAEKKSSEKYRKLVLVLDVLAFAPQLQIDPGESYQSFVELKENDLVWVVAASKKDSFNLHHWWFPIVGSVPYKGFFEQESARQQAAQLEERGYESWVRSSSAFSTLGWFNDPVVSSMLVGLDTELVNTLLHELTHQRVWIPGNVPFNESLANFVGLEGSRQFYEQRVSACEKNLQLEHSEVNVKHCDRPRELLKLAERQLQFELEFSAMLTELYDSLSRLYSHNLDREVVLVLRADWFNSIVKAFRARWPHLKVLTEINNAEIMQLFIYRRSLASFSKLYMQGQGDWAAFWSSIENFSESKDPFADLKRHTEN